LTLTQPLQVVPTNFSSNQSQEALPAVEELFVIEDQIANIAIKRAATSMRQSGERGMRAVQSSFPRLKYAMIYEEDGERMIF